MLVMYDVMYYGYNESLCLGFGAEDLGFGGGFCLDLVGCSACFECPLHGA